jgi:C-terminal processing protease CtpA/Prc
MKKLMMENFRCGLLAVLLLIIFTLPALAARQPAVFEQAFSLVMDNYVEQPDPSYLASSAVRGMEELLRANNRGYAGAEPDYGAIGSDKAKAVGLVNDTWSRLLESTGSDARELEHAAIRGMMASLDPHTLFTSPEA